MSPSVFPRDNTILSKVGSELWEPVFQLLTKDRSSDPFDSFSDATAADSNKETRSAVVSASSDNSSSSSSSSAVLSGDESAKQQVVQQVRSESVKLLKAICSACKPRDLVLTVCIRLMVPALVFFVFLTLVCVLVAAS